jgi:hypothetical protein
MMLASSTKHRREGDDKEDNNQKHEPDQETGEMIEITWRDFKRMIFLREKNVFTLNLSQPVGPTRFELHDLIHSAVHIQLASILSLTS